MDPRSAETFLAVIYWFSTSMSLISITTFVIVWQYWAATLDICTEMDCNCILYSSGSFKSFMGGNAELCRFASYTLIPVFVIGLSFGLYHGVRSCINRRFGEPQIIVNGHVVTVRSKQRAQFKQWILAAGLAALIVCLCLAHTIILTDGYNKTCEQYRKFLVQLLHSGSLETQVIYNRLSCSAVFDYMDYLHSNTKYDIRGEKIQTGVALFMALVTAWFNVVSWVAISVINFYMGKRRVNNAGEQLCCCCC